jgi:hypothetical protein
MNVRGILFLSWIIPAIFLTGCATAQVGRNFADRYFEIAAKIDEAETQGARDCAPRELASARVDLERALHEAKEPYYPRDWIQTEFDKAEIAADKVLATGRLRASQGGCPGTVAR